jgi:hypothetical protein
LEASAEAVSEAEALAAGEAVQAAAVLEEDFSKLRIKNAE